MDNVQSKTDKAYHIMNYAVGILLATTVVFLIVYFLFA